MFALDELTIKRLQKFRKSRTTRISLAFILIVVFISLTAEIWANSKPIIMSHHGRILFPIFLNYYPTDLGLEDGLTVVDYHELTAPQRKQEGDWAIWPLIPWGAYESNTKVDHYPSPPTKDNWLGTDDRGRDVLSRLIYGFRYSIGYALLVWFFSFSLGTGAGAIAGYLGGRVDLFGSRAVEIFEMTPQLLLLITIISIFTPSLLLLVVFSFLFDWTPIYHQMRGQFLQLRKRDYVDAARALGAGHRRILFRHILPNAITPLVTFSPFSIAANVSGLALLDYLGLGLKVPTPSWGELMSQAQKYFTTAEWLVWAPSLALLLTMIAFINIGLAARDAFDANITHI